MVLILDSTEYLVAERYTKIRIQQYFNIQA